MLQAIKILLVAHASRDRSSVSAYLDSDSSTLQTRQGNERGSVMERLGDLFLMSLSHRVHVSLQLS